MLTCQTVTCVGFVHNLELPAVLGDAWCLATEDIVVMDCVQHIYCISVTEGMVIYLFELGCDFMISKQLQDNVHCSALTSH